MFLLVLTLLAQAPAAAEPQIKVAVPALTLVGIDEKMGEFYASHLAQQLSYRGVQTITSSEIAALLGLERQRQLLGCNDDSCKADMMSTLGVDGVVVGRVTKLEKTYQLDVRILKPVGGQPLAAASANTDEGDKLVGIVTIIATQLANELSQKLGKKLSAQGGTEVVLQASKIRKRSWAPLAGGAVAFIVGGIFVGLAYSSASSLQMPRAGMLALDMATAERIASTGALQQTVGWVAISVGGACVVAAALMYLLGGNDVVQAGVALTPGGATLGLSGVWP